jgi:hypothetical protein
MRSQMKRFLFWSPRLLCILFAVFVSVFALDVFGQGYGFWKTILALSMHMIPTAIIILFLAISWRWEWVGGVLYIALGILYIVMFRGRFPWSVYVVMSGPLFLVGILFLIYWRYKKELRAANA